ncbi:MAG: hypothetical protein KTR18_11450 [Acidiferrobacterales bacterium]|nr:hypothetical protein [Acidiferrobacterales bacterium]
MEALEATNVAYLHPLPEYLADRILATSGQIGFEDLDKSLVALSKRGFIATNAIASGNDPQIIAGVKSFNTALNSYLNLCEARIYAPLRNQLSGSLSESHITFAREFQDMKQRLQGFMELLPFASLSHRRLSSKAICRIDKMIVQRRAAEREELYPLILGQTDSVLTA